MYAKALPAGALPLPIAGAAFPGVGIECLKTSTFQDLQTGRSDPCHSRIARQRDQHHKAERRKQELSNGLHQNIDDDACRGKRAWYGPECRQPRGHDVPTNLRQRKKRIDRFSNESEKQGRLKLEPSTPRKEKPPTRTSD